MHVRRSAELRVNERKITMHGKLVIYVAISIASALLCGPIREKTFLSDFYGLFPIVNVLVNSGLRLQRPSLLRDKNPNRPSEIFERCERFEVSLSLLPCWLPPLKV